MVALIPQTAGIRRDFIGEQQRAVGGAAHLDLEIDQLDVDLGEDFDQGFVDATGERRDFGQILAGAHIERHQIVVVHERIVQVIVLQEVLQHRFLELDALFDAQAGAEVAGGGVTQHDLEREHRDLLDQLGGLAHACHQVAVDAALLEQIEDQRGDEVVQPALAGEVFLLFAVTCGSGVLVFDPEDLRIVSCVQLLGFALVELFQLLHYSPFLVCGR